MTTIRVYEDEDEHKRKDIYQHEMEELVMDRARGFPGGEEEVENEDHQLGYREKLAIVLNSYRFHVTTKLIFDKPQPTVYFADCHPLSGRL